MWANAPETIERLCIVDHDPDEAEALMQEAGASKDGEGLWTLDGKRMGGDLYFVPSLSTIAPVVAEQLRRAGLEVASNSRPGFRDVVYQSKAAWWLWGHGGSVNDPYQTRVPAVGRPGARAGTFLAVANLLASAIGGA